MKIILIPFLCSFLLFICLQEGQLLYKPFEWVKNKVFPRLPISDKVLGRCILCTSFWMGLIGVLPFMQDLSALLILPYNAIATTFIFTHLKIIYNARD